MQRPYSLYDNIITFHCSDGDRRMRPDSLQTVTNDFVDYMEECRDGHPTLKLWKQKIGSFVAQYVLKRGDARYRKYTLSSLPAGYALFVHKKGDRASPRTDAYLWGASSGAVFRSPAEFFFHAKWIMQGCPVTNFDYDEQLWGKPIPEDFEGRCGCTYCANTDQGYISRTYSNYTPAGKGRRN